MASNRNWFWACVVVHGLTASVVAADTTSVTLLHTTDLHGALMAWDYRLDRPAERGLAKLSSLIASIRAEPSPVILVDAGDALAGGIETGRRPGLDSENDLMLAAMRAVGYDAMVPGNHEFDHGEKALDQLRRESTMPWLAANVSRIKGRPLFQPSMVIDAGGVRVGIVGVTTPATPRFLSASKTGGFRFDDPVERARAEVERLRQSEACDAIVLIAHTGLARDLGASTARAGDTPGENQGEALAAVPGVDVLVLGHTHVAIDSAVVNGVLVTQAGAHGTHLGRVDLTFARDDTSSRWRNAGRRARRIAVTTWNAEDPEIASPARSAHDALRASLGQVAGRAPYPVASPRGRLGPGRAWELIHRAQIWATGADVSLSALPNPEVTLAPGEVTARDLLNLYPYDNELEVIELSGAELRDALEWSARSFATYRFAHGAPIVDSAAIGSAFDAAHGVEYALDLTKPSGGRVVNLSWRGAPLDPDQRLRVAVNSYRANGANGYDMLRKARRLAAAPTKEAKRALKQAGIRGVPRVREAVAAYLSAGEWDGRVLDHWRLLPDYLGLPERPLLDRLARHGALPVESLVSLRWRDPVAPMELGEWCAKVFDATDAAMVEATNLEDALETIEGAAGPGLSLSDAAARESFRRGLVTGTSLAKGRPSDQPLTRAQALALVSNARFPWLRVLETTDFHGGILPGAAAGGGKPMGGTVALSSWIEQLRSANPEGTLLIDGGDMFQGTMISNFQYGAPVVEQMNALGYSAVAIGNHEFDWSVDTLTRRIAEMKFASLGANVREKKTGRMPAWVRADTVVTRRGVRVGVLGLCYRFTPTVTLASHVRQLEFLDDSTVAAERVPGLRARTDLVIGVGHVPCTSDRERKARGGDLLRLARGIPGVSAWFGGHSHNTMADLVDGLPIAIAGSHGRYVAVCDLVVDALRDTVLERSIRLQDVWGDSLPADPTMVARVERWNRDVAPIAAQQLGHNARALLRNRNGESTLGNFVTAAIRKAAGVEIALQNSGGLRANLTEGPISRGAIFEVMPFDNRVYTMRLTGAELKLAIEQGLARERVTQVSGIRYTFDLGRAPLDRVLTLTLEDGRPVEPKRRYRVACNDFMATGGDDYNALAGGVDRRETDLLVRETLERYVEALARADQPVDVSSDGRIQRAGSTQPQREDR